MNILIIGYSNIIGQPSMLASAVNDLTDHHVDVVVHTKNKYFEHFDKDVMYYGGPLGEMWYTNHDYMRLLNNADLIHYVNLPPNNPAIKGLRVPENIPAINHTHGSDCRNRIKYLSHTPDKIPLLVSTPDILQYVPNNINPVWLPNLIDMNTLSEVANLPKYDEVTICHSPSKRMTIKHYLKIISIPVSDMKKYGMTGDIKYGLKHSDWFVNTCRRYDLTNVLMEGMSNIECMEEKAQCHILFDQIFLGAYGVSLIEGLALGLTCMCGISDYTREYIEQEYPGCPIIRTSEETFKSDYNHAVEEYKQLEKPNKKWVNFVHGRKNVVKKYIEFIETVV